MLAPRLIWFCTGDNQERHASLIHGRNAGVSKVRHRPREMQTATGVQCPRGERWQSQPYAGRSKRWRGRAQNVVGPTRRSARRCGVGSQNEQVWHGPWSGIMYAWASCARRPLSLRCGVLSVHGRCRRGGGRCVFAALFFPMSEFYNKRINLTHP